MAEYIEREKAIERIRPHVKPTTVYGEGYMQAIEHATNILELIPAADVRPVKKTEFQIGYEQGFKDGRASAALPNTIDNGDKIDGYTYVYKTDSRGEPYIHIDSVRDMLKKAADVEQEG